MSYGVGHIRSLLWLWLWLWHRPAAVALIRSLAWAPPYAVGAALKTKKKKKKGKKRIIFVILCWVFAHDKCLKDPRTHAHACTQTHNHFTNGKQIWKECSKPKIHSSQGELKKDTETIK